MEDKKFYATVIVFLVLVSVFSYAILQSGQRDSYTVFYFTNPLEPVVYTASDSTLIIDFTVENHEKATIDYQYLIRLVYYDQTAVNTKSNYKGKITLNDGERLDISEKIVIEVPPGDRIKVLIELNRGGINETYRSLRYWVNTTNLVSAPIDDGKLRN